MAAALGMCRKLGLERILHKKRSRERDLALGAIVARLLFPCLAFPYLPGRPKNRPCTQSLIHAIMDAG